VDCRFGNIGMRDIGWGFIRGTFRVNAVGFENTMLSYGNIGEDGCRVGNGMG